MADARGIMLVMQNSKPGREEEHLDWYVGRHLPDVSAVPGVQRGELARLAAPTGEERWDKAACYWTSGDAGVVLAETMRRAQAGEWDLTGVDAIATDTTMMAVAEALTGRMRAPGTPDAQGRDRLMFIVLTNCTPGDDEAFNAWYSDRHIADVLDVPGFVAAQRFRLIDQPGLKTYPYRYLAIYEVRVSEAEAAFAELSARAGTDRMVLSPTLDTTDVHAQTFMVVESSTIDA